MVTRNDMLGKARLWGLSTCPAMDDVPSRTNSNFCDGWVLPTELGHLKKENEELRSLTAHPTVGGVALTQSSVHSHRAAQSHTQLESDCCKISHRN